MRDGPRFAIVIVVCSLFKSALSPSTNIDTSSDGCKRGKLRSYGMMRFGFGLIRNDSKLWPRKALVQQYLQPPSSIDEERNHFFGAASRTDLMMPWPPRTTSGSLLRQVKHHGECWLPSIGSAPLEAQTVLAAVGEPSVIRFRPPWRSRKLCEQLQLQQGAWGNAGGGGL